ncbi:unnamed protein product, partial [Prorocentrum cordatum]
MHGASPAAAPWRSAGAADPPDGAGLWSCVATRQCGFTRNWSTKEYCFQCGRDRQGRPGPNPPRAAGRRSNSRAGSAGARSAGQRPQPAGGAAPTNAQPSAAEAAADGVRRCRQAVASLRRLGFADESAVLAAARGDLEKAEAAERATRSPDDLYRSALDRMQARAKEVTALEGEVRGLAEQFESKRQALATAQVDLANLQNEVAGARAACAAAAQASAAPADPGELAAALGRVQTLLAAAPQALQAGRRTDLLQSIQEHFDVLAGHLPQQALAAPGTPGAAAGHRTASSLASFNGSCWPTFQGFLKAGAGGAAVAVGQELKLDGDELLRAEEWCRGCGWQPFITPCARTQLGEASAGVGIFVRSHISATMLEGCPTLLGHSAVPARAVAIHVDFAMTGGIIILGAYFQHGIGMTGSNAQLLLRIGEILAHFDRPYALAADWNVAPEVIERLQFPTRLAGGLAYWPPRPWLEGMGADAARGPTNDPHEQQRRVDALFTSFAKYAEDERPRARSLRLLQQALDDVAGTKAWLGGPFPLPAWRRLISLLGPEGARGTCSWIEPAVIDTTARALQLIEGQTALVALILLGGLERWLGTMAAVEERQAADGRRQAFLAWARRQMALGARALHCSTKPRGWCLEQFNYGGAPTASPQAVAEHQMEGWAKIWNAHSVTAPATWDDICGDQGPPEASPGDLVGPPEASLQRPAGLGDPSVPPAAAAPPAGGQFADADEFQQLRDIMRGCVEPLQPLSAQRLRDAARTFPR